MSSAERIPPRPAHLARLMAVWRSAGWPCRDGIELDLLAAGWARLVPDAAGRETLRVTAAGLDILQQARRRRSRSASLHDRLAARMCDELHRQGRIVWRELALRAPLPGTAYAGRTTPGLPGLDAADADADAGIGTTWRLARPDLFSIQHTSIEAALHPIVHEIKASRADLLADLRTADKGDAYRCLSCETYYVFPEGVAADGEIPPDFGIWTLGGTPEDGTLTLRRPARFVARSLGFAVWMALARAAPARELTEPAQGALSGSTDDGCD